MIRGLVFVIGTILVAAPGIAIVEPTFGRLLPGRGLVLSLVALGAVLVCAAAAWSALSAEPVSPGSKSRTLSRLFLAASVAVQAIIFVGVFRSPPGTFAGVGFVAGAIVVAPLVAAAVVLVVHGYLAAGRPAAHLGDVAAFLLVGFVLVLPALRVWRMLT